MENIKGKLLEFIKTEHNLSIDFVERAKKFQGDIYLYGAGNHLPFAVAFMQKYGVPVKGILDSRRPSDFHKSPYQDSYDGDSPS